MPQPDEITHSVDPVLDVWQEAHRRLLARIHATEGQRDATRLRALLAEVDAAIDAIEQATREDLTTRLPAVYTRGAVDTGLPLQASWTQTARPAVEALAHQNYAELLAATRHVRRATKSALRELVKAGAVDVLTAGHTANTAGLALTDLAQDATGNVLTVTYRNGAKHALADYADTALRTQTALAYNDGALDQMRAYDVQWVEIADGAACGLTAHDDPELANGMVVPIATAQEWPIAHPRCARSLLPRPDLTSARAAKRHNDARDQDALQADAAAERARAAEGTVTGRRFTVDTEQARVDRRLRAGRASRTPRTPRSTVGT